MSSSDEEYSDSSEASAASAAAAGASGKQRATFAAAYSDDDESSADEERIVRSASEKATIAMSKLTSAIDQKVKISDWGEVFSLFQKLSKQNEKDVRGGQVGEEAYLRCLIKLSENVNLQWEDSAERKKLSKTRYAGLSKLRSSLRKLLDSMQDKIEALPKIAEATEVSNAAAASSEEYSSSDEESTSEEESEDSDEWDTSSDESSDDDEEVSNDVAAVGGVGGAKAQPGSRRLKWVLKAKAPKVRAPLDAEKDAATARARQEEEERAIAEKIARRLAQEKKLAEKELNRKRRHEKELRELTPQALEAAVAETVAKFWKREESRSDLIERLRALAARAAPMGPRQRLPALMYVISSQLESSRSLDDALSLSRWREIFNDICTVLEVLEKNPKVRLALVDHDEVDAMASAADVKVAGGGENESVRVVGDVASFVTRLSQELRKALRVQDAHFSDEYVHRLADEGRLVGLAIRTLDYCERIDENFKAWQMALIAVELSYYKHDTVAHALDAASQTAAAIGSATYYHPASLGTTGESSTDSAISHPASFAGAPGSHVRVRPLDTRKRLEKLCGVIYSHGNEESKVRAMLCQIFHHARHDRFHEARDLLLMSRLQDTINDFDVEVQVLYNRTIASLGLCAFRLGFITLAQSLLVDLCGRPKELLAQGLAWKNPKFADSRDPEADRAERRRLIPYHMHVNLELLECVHLTTSVLLENPREGVSSGTENVSSKTFKRLLDMYNRQIFVGPPENARDHVLAASRKMRQGDWRACSDLILDLKIWDNFLPSKVPVLEKLKLEIKKEALRTRLATFAAQYESVSVESLSKRFELDESTVKAVLSRLMMSDRLRASWDGPCAALHATEPSHLQALSLAYADKARGVVEANERALERLTGQGFSRRDAAHGGGGGGGGGGDKSKSGGGGGKQFHHRSRGGPRSVNAGFGAGVARPSWGGGGRGRGRGRGGKR